MLLRQLSANDKTMIKSWIDDYAGGPYHKGERASIDTLLRYWNGAKADLYKLFGNQFILEKDVEFLKREADMSSEIYASMHGWGDQPMNEFYQAFYDWYWDKAERRYRWESLMFPEVLAENVYHGESFAIPTPDGKEIKVQEGTKPLRTLAKIAAAYDLKGFEDFRLGHSRILNQKKLGGRLCLSIHPMDYVTMSDNECDWDSCMSWRNDGCYRRGTVEMMNSQYVVVAYLKATEDMPYREWKWSNKKWRMLFIVDPQCIAGVKGYPYQHDELSKLCLDWLADLADKNMGWSYFPDNHAYDYYDPIPQEGGFDNGYRVDFSTDYMYNDFDSCTHWIRLGRGADRTIFINYSGVANCMWCGDIQNFGDEDEAETLVCDKCWDVAWCYHCDSRYEREDMYEVDGEYLCEYCYDNHTRECEITGINHIDSNLYKLYLASTERNEPNFDRDTYIYFYPSDLRYNSDLMPKFFPKAPNDQFYILHHTSHRWEDVYYVHPSECSEEGLELFGYDTSSIKDYVVQEVNSLFDEFKSAI
jgi:hypothetical protein